MYHLLTDSNTIAKRLRIAASLLSWRRPKKIQDVFISQKEEFCFPLSFWQHIQDNSRVVVTLVVAAASDGRGGSAKQQL